MTVNLKKTYLIGFLRRPGSTQSNHKANHKKRSKTTITTRTASRAHGPVEIQTKKMNMRSPILRSQAATKKLKIPHTACQQQSG